MARGKKASVSLTPEEKLQQALVPVEDQPYEIPENWCWVHLPDSFTNHTDSKKKIQTKAYLHEGQFSVVDQGQELVGGYTDDEDMLYSGDLPVIIFGDHTRCVKLIDFPFAQGADGVKVLKPKKFYDERAFYYALQAIDIPNLGYRRHFPLFPQLAIPVPPLAEQQRIVDRIESIFAKLDEAKEKAQVVVDGFELRKSAILHKAFTGELTAQWREEHGVGLDSWEEQLLKDVCKYMKAGGDKPADFTDEKDDDHPIPVVANGISDDGIIGYTAEEKYEAGTVTVSGRGTIGYSIYRDYPIYPVVRLIVLCPKEEVMPEYLKYIFDAFPEEGTGSSIPQLTVPSIKEKMIPVSSLAEQAEIVRIINIFMSKENEAKEHAESVIDQIDIMKKAVLARAFRGELGTNDPSEESAVELLKTVLLGGV